MLFRSRAEARLYRPAETGRSNDRRHVPSERMISDSLACLCRFRAAFERVENASRAGPTADELEDARQNNYYGLILTRTGRDTVGAHYYGPAGQIVSLGVFPLRK